MYQKPIYYSTGIIYTEKPYRNMTMPNVQASVIVPCYNGKNTIVECIRALKGQEFSGGKFEIIVVDDGSTDGSNELAQQEGAVVLSQANSGPAKARNLGAKESSG